MAFNATLRLSKQKYFINVLIRRKFGLFSLMFRRKIAKRNLKGDLRSFRIDSIPKKFVDFEGVILLAVSSSTNGISQNSSFLASGPLFKKVNLEELVYLSREAANLKVLVPLGDSREYDVCREMILYLNNCEITLLLHDTSVFVNWVRLLKFSAKISKSRVSKKELHRIRDLNLLVHSNYALESVHELKLFTNVSVIEIGVPAFYSQPVQTPDVRKEILIGTGGFWNVSRDPFKTFETFMILAIKHPDWNFSWGGELRPELQKVFERRWLKEFKSLERIHFIGFIQSENFGSYLRDLSVFLYLRIATSGESSGLVIECANQGTPIVFNSIGSLKELRTPPFKCVPTEARVEEIVDAIEDILSNEDKRLVMAEGLLLHAKGRDMASYREEIAKRIGL
jgi:glycosyltransferase involved in cell wall biosynthesis